MPTVPTYAASDYAQAMANLLPRGPVWPRDPSSNLMALMGGLAPTYERSGAAAAALLADIFPATTDELIPEWEETLGLPDPCTPLDPSTEQQRAAILAKFIGSGGQSVPYFIAVAAALGYTITITEYTPFRLGLSTFGSPLAGPGWEEVWQVNAPEITVSYFTLGNSSLGDPFWTVGNTELECRLRQIAPAQTILIFSYGGTPGGSFVNDGGVLTITGLSTYATSTSGLAAGHLWSNGGVVSVVSGYTPIASGPVYFGNITPLELLALGGASLPTTAPAAGSGQLWVIGDEVWIA